MTHIQREHVTEHMRRHLDPKLRRRQDVANDSVDATEADLTLWKRLVTYTIDVDIGYVRHTTHAEIVTHSPLLLILLLFFFFLADVQHTRTELFAPR